MSDGLQRTFQTAMPIARTALALPGARVYSTASVSLLDNTNVAIPFNMERFDDADYHSTSSNTSRLTIPQTGRYLCGGNMQYGVDTFGFRQLGIRLNGATFIVVQTVHPVQDTFDTRIEVCTLYEFTVGDYIELVAYQNAGVGVSVAQASAFSPEFWIQKVSA